MKIAIAPRARRDLASQLGYLVDQGAASAARRLERRLTAFLNNALARYPRSGAFIAHRDLWETWVPRTRLVVWYRLTEEERRLVREGLADLDVGRVVTDEDVEKFWARNRA